MVGEPLPITIVIYEEVLNYATPPSHFLFIYLSINLYEVFMYVYSPSHKNHTNLFPPQKPYQFSF